MPKGESPYLPFAQTINKHCAARATFVYIMEGTFGDSWCLWAPPEVAARLPEILNDAAEEIRSGEVPADETPAILLTEKTGPELYREAAEQACRLTNARAAFVYVLEGRQGSGWGVFAPPDIAPGQFAELIHGFADDLKGEEARMRKDAGLEEIH